MNALFHYNMQQQIAANEAARLQAQQALAKPVLSKDAQAMIYLRFIFTHGQATSQQLQTLRPSGASKFAVYKAISAYLRTGKLQFTRVSQYGGIYKPAEGVTAEQLGIDLGDEA